MLLTLHIIVALSGIGLTGAAYLAPSRTKLTWSIVLAAMTLISGIVLLFSQPSHLVQACVIGLMYFGLVGYGIVAANRRLQISR